MQTRNTLLHLCDCRVFQNGSSCTARRPLSQIPRPHVSRKSLARFYARSTRQTPPAPPRNPPPPLRNATPAPYQSDIASYTNILASRSSPTLLYQAPTFTSYPMTCYTIGGLSLAYGLVNGYDTLFVAHPGLAWPVPYLMLGVCLFTCGVGYGLGRAPFRLVESITAVPIQGQGLGPGVGGRGRGLIVRIERSQRIPFVSKKFLEVQPRDLYFQTGIGATREAYGADDDMMSTGMTARQRRKERQKYIDSISNPFSHLLKVLYKPFGWLFWVMRRAVTREGFAKLRAKEKLWLLDVKDGWSLDNGLALERLMTPRKE